MKLTTINLQIVRNLGNYESVRLGGEWSIDKDDPQKAFIDAQSELLAIADQLYPKTKTEPQNAKNEPAKTTAKPVEETVPPAEGPTDNRPEVRFGDPTLQQICNRIQQLDGDIALGTIKKYYRLSNKAEAVVNAAISFNLK